MFSLRADVGVLLRASSRSVAGLPFRFKVKSWRGDSGERAIVGKKWRVSMGRGEELFGDGET